jgi:putative acetyltransferase
MEPDLVIRPETADDAAAVRAVHKAAFETPLEARLVDALRHNGKALVSLVAEADGRVVGHILFSPVTLVSSERPLVGAGLAPVAVTPSCQRRGIGKRLIQEGLSACARNGSPFVVVLGAPAYYRQFGFRRASARGVADEYGVDEEFMLIELQGGALPSSGGLAKYAPEFAEAEDGHSEPTP